MKFCRVQPVQILTCVAAKLLRSLFVSCHLSPSFSLILMFPLSRNAPTGEYLIHSRVKGDFACRRIPESVTIMDVMNSYLALTLSPLPHA
jgi:hypothetical protein